MVTLKLRLRSLPRQSVLLFSSLELMIIIGLINIMPLPVFFRIVLVLFPYVNITLHFDLWLSIWGKAWILSSTLLIVASLVYPNHLSVPLLLGHVLFLLFLLGILFFYDKQRIQQRLLHQCYIKAMHVMLWNNLPLIQTVDYSHEAVIILDNTGAIIDSNSQSSLLLYKLN